MVLIFKSTNSREISGTNFTLVRLSGKYHSALLHAILLPLNLTLVKFILNVTPTFAIYIYVPTSSNLYTPDSISFASLARQF